MGNVVAVKKTTFPKFAVGDSSLAAGDVVALTPTGAVRADAQNPDKMPAIGFAKKIVSSGGVSGVIVQVIGKTRQGRYTVSGGDVLYVDPTTPGGLTTTEPTSDDFLGGSGVIQKFAVGTKQGGRMLIQPDAVGVNPFAIAGTDESAIAAEDLLGGHVVSFTSDAELAPAISSDLQLSLVAGIAKSNKSAGESVSYQYGGEVAVQFVSVPAESSNGDRVYLSAAAGKATLTPPASGSVVQIGFLTGADGSSSKVDVFLQIKVTAVI